MSNSQQNSDAPPAWGCALMALVLFSGFGFLGYTIYQQTNAPVVKSAKEKRIDNIVRVFVHNPGEYSVLVANGKTLEPRTFRNNCLYSETQVLMDVPPGEPMYAVIISYSKNGSPYKQEVFLHIHSQENIEGAGWYRGGKPSTSGQTHVVE